MIKHSYDITYDNIMILCMIKHVIKIMLQLDMRTYIVSHGNNMLNNMVNNMKILWYHYAKPHDNNHRSNIMVMSIAYDTL